MTDALAVTHETIDAWAVELHGPVALHLRQKLLPVEGRDGIIFPPTYAMEEKERGPDKVPYSIDILSDGTKLAQIDSVGAQANRMEPLFRKARPGRSENPLAKLVPQNEIVFELRDPVSILDAGHRLGDAVVRSSELKEEAEEAFLEWQKRGDATKIAKIAPTSLVFGAWDSRGEGAKFPRLVQAVIRAWNVDPIKRSAQYNPPIDYSTLEVFDDDEKQKIKDAQGNSKSPLAQRGFVHVPAVNQHGGVVARGDIIRDVTINLIALRQLGGDESLHKYILGLALVAAVEPQDGYLRQGCFLTLDPEDSPVWNAVERSGKRTPIVIDLESITAYAVAAAKRFGVAEGKSYKFLKTRAKADLKEDKKEKKKKGQQSEE